MKKKNLCPLVIQQSKECRTVTLCLKAEISSRWVRAWARVRGKGSGTETELVKDNVSRIVCVCVWGGRLWNYPLIHFADVSCNHGAWMCSFNGLDLLLCAWNGLNSQFFSLFVTFKFSIYFELSSMKISTIFTKVRQMWVSHTHVPRVNNFLFFFGAGSFPLCNPACPEKHKPPLTASQVVR